jgi:hypothetical protein
MNKPKLFYDGNCFICTNYVRLMQRKIPADKLDFIPSVGDRKDFGYESISGIMYEGQEAIDVFAKEIPEVQEYFWMLPSKYRVQALQAAYQVSSAVRGLIKKTRGCNCGK